MKSKKTHLIIPLMLIMFILMSCKDDKVSPSDIVKENGTESIISGSTVGESDNFKINSEILISEKFILTDVSVSNNLNDSEINFWSKYENSPIVDVIKKHDDTLSAATNAGTNDPIKIFETNDGYFIGTYYGEFNGTGLHFKPTDGDFYDIDKIGVAGFYTLGKNYDIIYYLSGYSNLTMSEGYINRLIKEDNVWKKDENFEIILGKYSMANSSQSGNDNSRENFMSKLYGNYPKAFCLNKNEDTIYIITDTKLFMIKDNILTELLNNAYWYKLSPSSIVLIDDNVLYIGMRGGIASYGLETGELLWYEKVSEGE